ncbi:MAG: ABC transporter ATP-binding protein [Anaerolineae bacterium]|nr:ABC transporter ATP-binding protein [Anaerolineae bacterium]
MSQDSRGRESRVEIPLGRRPRAIGAGEKPKDARGTVRRLWGYLRRQRLGLLAVFLLVAAGTAFDSLGPYLMGRAIDSYMLKGDLPGLAGQVGLMVGVYAGASAMAWLQTYVVAGVAQRTVRDIRNDLFAKLQTLSLRFFDRGPHGDLMSRLTNDVENISTVLTESVTQLFSSFLMLVSVASIMLWLNWRLALVSLLTMPLMVALTTFVAKRTRRGYRRQQRALGELNSLIEENISGARVVQAYGQEAAAIEAFESANCELRRASTMAQTFAQVLGPLSNMVNNIGYAIVAGVGGWMAFAGLATVGTIASFVDYARRLSRPLNEIANLYNSIQSAIAGAERVFELLDEVPELVDTPGAPALRPIAGEVVFDGVSFGYEEGVPVLRDVSLRAEPGQTIALVGPTGAGKTTIVNLLTRFYDIDHGHILIDGQEIRTVRKDSLRRQLGIVLQDTFLFSATVMDNIRYGRLDATDEEVETAARLANADFFIRRLPHGYQTLVAERGSNLSQGQRQLLAIARTILAGPGILVLDEATSSVDTRTEAHIQSALLRLMKGRTSFVIAHRLSTIREADEILVIDGGRIVERGDHRRLLAEKGFYYGLYMSQFRGQATAK